MNKAFEKILERLEELQNNLLSQTEGDVNLQVGVINGVMYSKKIVQEVAEEYNDGWIPCSERLQLVENGYNKALNDFVNACKSNTLCQTFGLRQCDIDEMAEQLKEGREDENSN